MNRGELYRVRQPSSDDPKRTRIYVVVSRQAFIEQRIPSVICAPVHSQRRGLESEVEVGIDEGLKHPSTVLCDLLTSLPKSRLTDYVGSLSPPKLLELRTALRIALAVE